MDDTDAPRAVLVVVVGDRELPLGVVGASGPGDLRLVDALLRLHLALGRRGAALRLLEVRADLRETLELVGVTEALGLVPPCPPADAPYASMRSGSPKRGKSSG